MVSHDLKALVSMLSPGARAGFEAAAVHATEARHADLTVAHVLAATLKTNPPPLAFNILAQLGVLEAVCAELDTRLNSTPTGPDGPVPSLELLKLLRAAWHVRGLAGREAIDSGVILATLIDVEEQRTIARLCAPTLLTIPRGGVLKRLSGSTSPSRSRADDSLANSLPTPEEPEGPGGSGTPSLRVDVHAREACQLAKFTHDFTAKAANGDIDPVVGRESEIRQLLDILSRRRQNNPMLVGDAGVGKTAVVEGLALRIAAGDVPPVLHDVRLLALDLGLLRAGATYQGEFEERLQGVLAEVAASAAPIVLFIDEAHSLVGAGGRVGTGDAANLLKPALARGDLRTIGATTWAEYKRHLESDPALTRRFQTVVVEEPSLDEAEVMLRSLVPKLTSHHGVQLLDEAVVAAVRLSHRYVSGRRLPDKAVSILDTACARVALAQSGTPAALEAERHTVLRCQQQIDVLAAENGAGGDHQLRLAALYAELDRANADQLQLTHRWEREQSLVDRILGIDSDGVTARRIRSELELELAAIQGAIPLLRLRVDARTVAEVIADWTGIPASRMVFDESQAVLSLAPTLTARVRGQHGAMERLSRRLLTSSARMEDPNRPLGVFLLVGPTGTGKTWTAQVLADALYGGDRGLVTVNMSEYQEAHSVAGLKGAPPGYVGYGEGGVLTEAVRRRPYSLVLLDEVEKAHRDVLDLFLPIFDHGTIDDAEGLTVDFRNTVIVMTTSVGADLIGTHAASSDRALTDTLRPLLESRFPRGLLSRLTVVPFRPLALDALVEIARAELDAIASRIQDQWAARLDIDDDVAGAVAERCDHTRFGARAVSNLLGDRLMPHLARALLVAQQAGAVPACLRLTTHGAHAFAIVIDGQHTSEPWDDGPPRDPPSSGAKLARVHREDTPIWSVLKQQSTASPRAFEVTPSVKPPSVVPSKTSASRSALALPYRDGGVGWVKRLRTFIQRLSNAAFGA
ncbi:MAG: type VI secretion system protein VasG [Myxococcota bacterium]|jgi:type VI secretion system protein VasG